MRNKNNLNVAQLLPGDFSQYARSCAALSTEKQINFQTMRYKDASPMNIKAKTMLQQQQQITNQPLQLKSHNSNKGLQFYLSQNNQNSEVRQCRLQNDQKFCHDQQSQRHLQDKNCSIKSLDTLKRRVLDTTLKFDKENLMNLVSYPQTALARNQTLRMFRPQEKNIFQENKSKIQSRQFTEDALFQEDTHKGQFLKGQQIQTPLTEALIGEQNNHENQQQQTSENSKNILNTSLSLNSRVGRKRNNVIDAQRLSQLNNFQVDINDYQTLRSRKNGNRKSEGPVSQNQQFEQPKIQQRYSLQGCQQNNDISNDDTSTAQFSQKQPSNININNNTQISNKLQEQNYSLQNKTFLIPQNQQNICSQVFNAKSSERTQILNTCIKKQNPILKLQVKSERNLSSNLNSLNIKKDENKFNFEFHKIQQDHSRLNKNNQENILKSDIFQTKIFSNQTSQDYNLSCQLKSKELIPLNVVNKSNNVQLEDWNISFFHLNSKNYNDLLKVQLRTASNFNNVNKDNSDQLKKTKMFFSSKQQIKKVEPFQNNIFEFYNQSSQDALISASPLASQDLNKFSQRYAIQTTLRKENQNCQQSQQKKIKVQGRDAKKQNRRGSSLMDQLEYEYNNTYYNQNNLNLQQSQINIQTQNASTLIQNNFINSSPLIQVNQTPSQSFCILHNSNNNKAIKKQNQHTSQLFSQISTFTNLNLLEQEEDQVNDPIKQLYLQKTPSIILATPSLSKYGSMNFDQQPQNSISCKEINNYFGDMKRVLSEQIKLDQQFQVMIEQKLLINIDQFLYFLSHFWKFCIENFDNFQKDFAIFKIEEKFLQKINDIMNNFLNEQSNLSKDKIQIFMNSFYFHSQRLILPKNLFEHIGKFILRPKILFLIYLLKSYLKLGGQNQAQKLINNIINHLKFDISFGVQFAKILNEIDPLKACQAFCSFLKDDIEGIKDAIIYANKQLNITQVEFFLIKQTIYHVLMSDQLLRKDHKMTIIEKFEKLRAFILQDHTQLNLLQDQNIHETLMIKIRNNRSTFKKFKNKERQQIVDFASFTFSMIFGRITIQEYIEKLKSEICILPIQASQQFTDQQLLEESDYIQDKSEEDDQQLILLNFINEIEALVIESVNDFMDLSSIYNTEKHIKLKFQFIKENINKQFLSVINKGSTLIKELRFWAVTNFKKYLKNIEMTEGENSRLDIMDSILKFYFYRKSDVFSFYDVPIAINYFPITKNAVEYWITGLKAILNEERFRLNQSEIEVIVNQIQSLFSVRWVKKKNQLFFIQTPQI